jgi:ATP-dependent DNA ligase
LERVPGSAFQSVRPGLIPGFSVQLAHVVDVETNPEGTKIIKVLTPITYPVYVDPKLDGFRLIAIKESGKVSLWTRNGNELETLPELKKVLESAEYDDLVLDGEIFGTDWSVSASVVLSEKNVKDETLLNYHTFDAIPVSDWKRMECNLILRERQEVLRQIVKKISNGRVQYVLGCEVESEEELLSIYEEHISSGWEGGMVKNPEGTYDFTRSNSVLKLKPTSTHEGVVVGWYEGKPSTKWEGLFGGFEVMLVNGVTTRVGTGFKDDVRMSIHDSGPNSYKGKIVEVAGQLLTEDGKIRFPRFKRFRDPRDVDPSVVALAESCK